jgi:DNA-binding SARP family transcriptional activator
LWRVAERIYGPGGGSRWPELFQLNRGIGQPDGRALSNPNLVRPGWKIIAFVPTPKEEVAPLEEHEPPPPSEQPAPPKTAERPASSGEAEQSRDQTGPGLNLVTGAFVSVGLATAVTAAVMSARMWRRRRYRIGSGDRADLQRPIAPVIRALRAADQRVDDRPEKEIVDLASRTPSVDSDLEPDGRRILVRAGVRGDRELAVSLASTHGLGLAGAGALTAARALLLHILAGPQVDAGGVRLIVPSDDFHHVFDGFDVDNAPSTVHVADSLDAALDEMESALLTRTRCTFDEDAVPGSLVLLASPAPHAERRLQAVLDNGSDFGLAGILLGQWRPGVTVLVRDDGTVRATSLGPGEVLIGTHLFLLPAVDANDLLIVLREAEGQVDEPMPVVTPSHIDMTAPPRSGDESSGADTEGQETVDVHDEPPVVDPSRPRLSVSALGRVQVVLHGDDGDQEIGGTLTPKQREMLVFLALHPDGARREALNEALWPNSRPPRPYNSFHNTLSVLRRALADATGGTNTDFVLNEDGRYRLNSDLVDVDFWHLQRALGDSLVSDTGPTTAVEIYRGDLAEDVTAAWAEPIRESVRRDVLDALGSLVRAHSDIDPEKALILLERTRKLDPYNEDVYRSLIRHQARLDRYDAIPRAVALLATTLDEIGERPSTDILQFADFLQRRGSTRRTSPDNAAAS